MRDRIPTLRLRTDQGRLVARDGLVLCFFMRHSHGEVAQAVWRALEVYRRAIPPHALAWYVDYDGNTLPLDEQGESFLKQEVLECTRPADCIVGLWEHENEVGGYNFEYQGCWPDSLPPAHQAEATCALTFSLPTEYLLAHGPDAVRALAMELARELPLSFGYASLALVSPGGRWYTARRALMPILERYLGFDLYRIEETSRVIGPQARGAYWLTFLGPWLLGELGGLQHLRQQLAFPEVTLLDLGRERALLAVGEWPEAIDTHRELYLPHLRAVAHLLEPFLYEERTGWFSTGPDNMRRWLRRLCQ